MAKWLCGCVLHAPFQLHPDWRLIVAVHPRPLGCPLFCCFGWFLSVFFRWLSPFAWLCAFVGSSVASLFLPFALGLSVVLLVVCVTVSPLPLGCSRVASWPNQASAVLVPPSRYLVASCDGLVALPVAWSVVLLCFLASCCSTAVMAFGPVWGNWFTSTSWGICCCGALRSFTEVFIFMMIQVPLNTVKLCTRYSCWVCDILFSCPGLPSRRSLLL